MHKITNFLAIWVSIICVTIYFISYYFLGYWVSKFSSDIFALLLVCCMAAATTPEAIKAIKNGIRTGPERFIFSYWFIWGIILFQRIWVITLSSMGKPTWLVEGPVSGLIAIGVGISAGFGMAAPLTGPDPLQKRTVITMTIAGIISGIIVGSLTTYSFIMGSI